MLILRPVFHACAAAIAAQYHDSDTDSETDAEAAGAFTLEMTDDPFRGLMRRIEKLMDTGLIADLQDAFSLTRTALLERTFTGRSEEKLNEKLAAIIVQLHEDRPLGSAFARSVHNVQLAPAANMAFIAAAPAPAASPAP